MHWQKNARLVWEQTECWNIWQTEFYLYLAGICVCDKLQHNCIRFVRFESGVNAWLTAIEFLVWSVHVISVCVQKYWRDWFLRIDIRYMAKYWWQGEQTSVCGDMNFNQNRISQQFLFRKQTGDLSSTVETVTNSNIYQKSFIQLRQYHAQRCVKISWPFWWTPMLFMLSRILFKGQSK